MHIFTPRPKRSSRWWSKQPHRKQSSEQKERLMMEASRLLMVVLSGVAPGSLSALSPVRGLRGMLPGPAACARLQAQEGPPFLTPQGAPGGRKAHLMPRRADSMIPPADLDTLLRKIVTKGLEPLTLNQIRRALPSGVRIPPAQLTGLLERLIKQGQLFVWPGRPPRYASHPFEAAVRERIIKVLEQYGPLTKAALAKKLPKSARPFLGRALDDLCRNGRVFKHPKLGRREPYGLTPPESLPYLRPKLESLMKTLQQQGFGSGALWAALRTCLWEVEERAIREAMSRLNPHVARGALVYIPELREAARSHFSDKLSFDQAVLRLAEQGTVQLQSHDRPADLTPEERAAMIPNRRGSYFMAIGLRME